MKNNKIYNRKRRTKMIVACMALLLCSILLFAGCAQKKVSEFEKIDPHGMADGNVVGGSIAKELEGLEEGTDYIKNDFIYDGDFADQSYSSYNIFNEGNATYMGVTGNNATGMEFYTSYGSEVIQAAGYWVHFKDKEPAVIAKEMKEFYTVLKTHYGHDGECMMYLEGEDSTGSEQYEFPDLEKNLAQGVPGVYQMIWKKEKMFIIYNVSFFPGTLYSEAHLRFSMEP